MKGTSLHLSDEKYSLFWEGSVFFLLSLLSGEQSVISLVRDNYGLVLNWDAGAVSKELFYNNCLATLFKPIGFLSTQLHVEIEADSEPWMFTELETAGDGPSRFY